MPMFGDMVSHMHTNTNLIFMKCTGFVGTGCKAFWKWDVTAHTWQKKRSVPEWGMNLD